MKKYLLSLVVIAAGSFSALRAQTITIAAARAQGTGSVHVQGTVLNGPEFGPLRFIQDASGAAIGVYSSAFASTVSANVGDSIDVSGPMVQFNNLLEISGTGVNVTKIGLAQNPVQPLVYQPNNISAAFVEANEGKLLKLKGLFSLTNGSQTTFAGNTNYTINGNGTLQLRAVTTATTIVGANLPTDTFDVVGIMSQFCPNSTVNCTTGYQFQPRTIADFTLSGKPALIGKLTQIGADTNALAIKYKTSNPTTTVLRYGKNPGVYTDSVSQTGSDTAHTFWITGLNPATVYYFQPTLINSAGSKTFNGVPFVTTSKSSGIIKTYFNNPVNNNVAFRSNKAVYLNNLVDDTLIAYINRAKESIDIAIYNWNNTGISDITAAVNAAYNRGVKVRVVADGTTAQAGMQGLLSAIGQISSPASGTAPGTTFRYTIMHNKFVVIDANSSNPNDAYVWTGSTNWTKNQINSDFNNVIIIQDQSLARVYRLEFEEMFGSTGLQPGSIYTGTSGTARFGAAKTDNTPHLVKVGGRKVEVYFSPSDGTNSQIINAVNSANNSLQTANLVITRSDITRAISNLSTFFNKCSGAIVDDTSGAGVGPFITLRNTFSSRAVLKPSTYSGQQFHHKYMIVDSDLSTSDPLVLTGSHNWSSAGDNQNDENTVIVHDAFVANQYFQEFYQRMTDMGPAAYSTLCQYDTTYPVRPQGLEQAVANVKSLSVYPNPASQQVQLEINNVNGPVSVALYDAAGRTITSKTVTVSGGLTETLNLNGIASGLYLIRVAAEGRTYTQKLSVE